MSAFFASLPDSVGNTTAIEAGLEAVTRWVERHDYRAYDPGDGCLSPLRYLTFNTHFLRRLLTGAVLRAPFHIRPWIGIRPHTSTKGMGYMAWGYTDRYTLSRAEIHRERAQACFEWLTVHSEPGFGHYCWGNHFSFSTRAGTIPAHTPTIVWSSLIAMAFLEAYEVFGLARYLDVAASTAEWVKTLPRERTSRGICLSYVPFEQTSIHNSNLLGAALLARVAAHTGDREGVELAREAVRYTCSRQNPDGSWFYGEHPKYHWIDNFHTGYNLDSLKRFIESAADREFEANLKIGFQYFASHFFEEDGRPRYYNDRTLPTDIQCAAQAIDTLVYVGGADPVALALADRVAQWTLEHMQAPDGHFYYRDLGWKKVETPMLHWGQATMFKALAHLLSKLNGQAKDSSQCDSTSPCDLQRP